MPALLSILCHLLDNNADKSSIGVVYNLLHGILQFHLAFLSDLVQFASYPVFHQLLNRLSKNIDLPDSFFLVSAVLNILDQSCRQLLFAHNGRDLRLDIGTDHMYGR